MIIELDMSSDTPIYVQLRNQIVKGIGKGEDTSRRKASHCKTACGGCRREHNDCE